MSRLSGKRKLSPGVLLDPSTIPAREILAANKDQLHAPAMHWANQTSKLVQPQKYQAIVPPAQDLLQHGAVLDAERDKLSLIGRGGRLVAAYADSRTNSGPGAPRTFKPKLAVNQTGDEGDIKSVPEEANKLTGEDSSPPPPSPNAADLGESSKGLLLVVAFGAALAAVLLAFK